MEEVLIINKIEQLEEMISSSPCEDQKRLFALTIVRMRKALDSIYDMEHLRYLDMKIRRGVPCIA